MRRDFDEEDVALSVFQSLCDGVKSGKFSRLDDRVNLWALLVVITSRCRHIWFAVGCYHGLIQRYCR